MRNYTKNCATRFNEYLSSGSWDNLSEFQDVSNAWLNFNHVSCTWLITIHLKLKESSRQKHPLVVKQGKEVMAQRDRFYSQARRANTELHWSRYKSSRNQITAMIRKAKSNYNRRIIGENSDDHKNFWKAVSPEKSFPTNVSHLNRQLIFSLSE